MQALRAIELRDGDELLVADNTAGGVLAARFPEGFRTAAMRQPYSARNEAAARAATSGCCSPTPTAVRSRICSTPTSTRPRASASARWRARSPRPGTVPARSRSATPPTAACCPASCSSRTRTSRWASPRTCSCAAARSTALGGFAEGIRSGGDADLCWRLQDAGWTIEHRPRAIVAHEHRATVRALLRQAARTAAGRAGWRGAIRASTRTRAARARAARALAGIVGWPLRGKPERGAFKAIELLVIATEHLGRLAGNARPPRTLNRSVNLSVRR